jgi:DNA-binding response OmpR family regulator
MEGTELLPVIERTSPQTVKIMLSGNCLHGVVGADALLGKPINPEKLLSIIESKLRDRNLET